ncbi:SRPBCC domain-containing protein [Lysinibacter sp. HNR]|uniref:SRPBCC family protein n=1 Tax=Lysinibacter sp. HNR TaxID=3031408 RepID=UPI002435BC18|nr:SRPBCC domain-containing protein [Lysinibacter sp. HNR]WGD37724.1 SRPBCC domain-containing protein [Lysinibacter sp. HNR]
MSVGPVIAHTVLSAPRETAWQSLVDPQNTEIWWPDLTLEASIGGGISEIWEEEDTVRHATGTVDIMIAGHSLGFTWQDVQDKYPTSVLIVLRSEGDKTRITVTETGLDMLEDAAHRALEYQEVWGYHLEDLRAFVAGELVGDEEQGEGQEDLNGADVQADADGEDRDEVDADTEEGDSSAAKGV